MTVIVRNGSLSRNGREKVLRSWTSAAVADSPPTGVPPTLTPEAIVSARGGGAAVSVGGAVVSVGGAVVAPVSVPVVPVSAPPTEAAVSAIAESSPATAQAARKSAATPPRLTG